MPNRELSSLLEPTLAPQAQALSLFSVTSMFVVAFFGGTTGLTIFALANSRQLNTVPRDLPIYLIGCALAVVAGYLATAGEGQSARVSG